MLNCKCRLNYHPTVSMRSISVVLASISLASCAVAPPPVQEPPIDPCVCEFEPAPVINLLSECLTEVESQFSARLDKLLDETQPNHIDPDSSEPMEYMVILLEFNIQNSNCHKNAYDSITRQCSPSSARQLCSAKYTARPPHSQLYILPQQRNYSEHSPTLL